MSYAEDGSNTFSRGRDDETQTYLLQWFHGAAEKPGFAEVFQSLTPQEQEKLRNMS